MNTITKTLFAILLLSGSMVSRCQIISTIAGNGAAGFSGDGGQATAAEFWYSSYVTFDTTGNLYISDYVNARVRMINSSGVISTVAGNGGSYYVGDGGPATAAEFNVIAGISADVAGNLYICDEYAYVVRKVNTSGIINAFAGNNALGFGYSGDGGPATAAELYFPTNVAFDTKGNVYIADEGASLIRKVDTAGIITTFAGNYAKGRGYSGDGGPATAAELYAPCDVTFDRGGNLYIADANNHVIRRVNSFGIISTFAGDYAKGGGYSGDGSYATMAEINTPTGIKIDASGNLYIADQAESVVRVVNNRGMISTCAGNVAEGAGYSGDGGPATAAELNTPTGLALDKAGKLYIGDMVNNRVRVLDPITTGMNEVSAGSFQLTVYPNPSTGKFNVICHSERSEESRSITIYNVLGETIYDATLDQVQRDNLIDFSNKANGIYFYRVIANSGNIIGEGKILVQK